MTTKISFGLDTFGDSSVDEQGNPNSDAQTIRDIVDQAILADQLGLDHFNVGEHHRDDFAVSAPDTVLAGIATVTKNIKLGSGVTVLSSEDPVRVYQRFATNTTTPAPILSEILPVKGCQIPHIKFWNARPIANTSLPH